MHCQRGNRAVTRCGCLFFTQIGSNKKDVIYDLMTDFGLTTFNCSGR